MPTIQRARLSWPRTLRVLVALVLFGVAGFTSDEDSEEELPSALSTVSAVEGFTSCGTNPRRPLPVYDYSRVGYRQNTVAVPYRQRTSTRSYGPGRHRITRLLQLRSGQVLRGAGRDRTVLYFPGGLKGLGVPCSANPRTDCWDWGAGVVRATGAETGLEDLTIEFPAHSWTHHGGASVNGGYNGISLESCTNCWVKNVTVRNADNGLMILGGANNTIDGLHVYGNPDGAHIHVAMSRGAQHNLVTN